MLKLIGIGLWDEKDLTLRAIEEAQSCSQLYVEFYTSHFRDIGQLSHIIGKNIVRLERHDLEEKSDALLARAEKETIGILIGGDPLAATTHVALVLEAHKRRIPTRIVPGISILSAVSKVGLFLYNFGCTVTLPRWLATPSSVFEKIQANQHQGWHTLILIDIGMTWEEAKERLLQFFSPETSVVLCSHVGAPDEVILYGPLHRLPSVPLPFVVIVPGKLHFIEAEALEHFSLKP